MGGLKTGIQNQACGRLLESVRVGNNLGRNTPGSIIHCVWEGFGGIWHVIFDRICGHFHLGMELSVYVYEYEQARAALRVLMVRV